MRKVLNGILALLIIGSVLTFQPNSMASATSSSTTWGDYSLMFTRSAGQYYAGTQVGGQWAWAPQSATVSDISWGDPASWPPKYAERLILSGNWVLLDGYSNGQGSQPVQVQRVTSEKLGDASCNNMKPIASDNGRQHYAQWNTPSADYCLDATGSITSTTTGTVVHFRHRQQWGAPATCSNAYIANRSCITQHEQWWDDNGHSYALQLDRTQYLAKGLGMAFKIRQTYPTSWSADGRYYWYW
jgi:hypothetical protein